VGSSNPQATLVTKQALWTLRLPVSVDSPISDAWRAYIAQRLLKDAGYQVALIPAVIDQYRITGNHLSDSQAEELYNKSLALSNYLREWQGSSPTLEGRFEELIIGLYEREFLEVEDVYLTQAWIAALAKGGYHFPAVEEIASTRKLLHGTTTTLKVLLAAAENNIKSLWHQMYCMHGQKSVFNGEHGEHASKV